MVTVATKLRRLLLGRIVMKNLDSVLKARHITLPTKVHIAKAKVFSVVIANNKSREFFFKNRQLKLCISEP